MKRWSRILVGAWHVPSGFSFLVRHPAIWPPAVLPVVLTVVLVGGGGVAGYLALSPIIDALATRFDSLPDALRVFALSSVVLGTLLAGMFLGLALALALAGPLLERLSRSVEATVMGRVSESSAGLGSEILQALRASAYFLLRIPIVFVVSLIPVVGPLLGLFWAAHGLALQQTEATLARQGMDFEQRRIWHRRFRPESLGFGLAGLAFLLIPVANMLLMPTLVIGATRLALLVNKDDGAS